MQVQNTKFRKTQIKLFFAIIVSPQLKVPKDLIQNVKPSPKKMTNYYCYFKKTLQTKKNKKQTVTLPKSEEVPDTPPRRRLPRTFTMGESSKKKTVIKKKKKTNIEDKTIEAILRRALDNMAKEAEKGQELAVEQEKQLDQQSQQKIDNPSPKLSHQSSDSD